MLLIVIKRGVEVGKTRKYKPLKKLALPLSYPIQESANAYKNSRHPNRLATYLQHEPKACPNPQNRN